MGNKDVERKCLEIVLHDKPKCQFGKDILKLLNDKIIDDEKPDFIINRIGIEHFLVDLLFSTKGKHAMSIERKNASSIREKVDYYKSNPEYLNIDMENGAAVKFTEDIINSEINGANEFSCERFIDNFKQIFNNHFNKRFEYRKKCQKLGFLIEIPYMNGNTNYLIIKGERKNCQHVRTMPIPKEIINYIWNHSDLDFVILCITPINFGDKISRKDINIIYFDPKKRNLFNQKFVLCDKFDFVCKYPNNFVKLEVEHE